MRPLIVAVSLALCWVQPSTGQSPPPHVRPRARFEPVGLADTKWTAGFWADRFETCRAATVPAMGRIMEGTDHSHFLENFRYAWGNRGASEMTVWLPLGR